MKAIKQLDVSKHCDLVAGGYAIDASMLEHVMGWPKGALRPRIELCDGAGWETVVNFVTAIRWDGSPAEDGDDIEGWKFASAAGVTLLVLND